MNRRNFLKTALSTGALCSANGLPLLSGVAQASGFAPLAQRVLVNITLQGGPDLRHLMPPAYSSNPESYGYRYWEAKAAAHSIANTASAYQARWDNDYFSLIDGQTNFGILKSCGWLKRMWDAGNVAIISNAIGARTRNHAHCSLTLDQGNLTSGPNDINRPGWGGRLANAGGGNVLALTRSPRRFCYGPDPLDPENSSRDNLISVANSRKFSLYQPIPSNKGLSDREVMTRSLKSYYSAKANELNPNSPYSRVFEMEKSIRKFSERIDERMNQVPLPTSIGDLVKGVGLSHNYIGAQIRNLYDSLAANDILSLRVASMEYGSWDSHKNQRDLIEPKLVDLFGDNKTFDTLYQEIPQTTQDNLVLVFAGEFGRQLRSNGANGSDHGKGNSVMVIGNAVNGGLYGDMFPQEELSRLDITSADIKGLTEFDHILGSVADWVVPGSGDVVFPQRTSATIELGVSFANLFS